MVLDGATSPGMVAERGRLARSAESIRAKILLAETKVAEFAARLAPKVKK